MTARFFDSRQGASSQARLFYVVDAGLVIGFAAIGLTGLVISTWLDLSLANYASWFDLHVAACVGTLALLVAKIGLHWRWIIGVPRRSILPQPTPAVRAGSARALQPTPPRRPRQARRRVRLRAPAACAATGGAHIPAVAAGTRTATRTAGAILANAWRRRQETACPACGTQARGDRSQETGDRHQVPG